MNWYVKEVSGNRAVIDKSEDGTHSINSPIDVANLEMVKGTTTDTPSTPSSELYRVRISWNDVESQRVHFRTLKMQRGSLMKMQLPGIKCLIQQDRLCILPK